MTSILPVPVAIEFAHASVQSLADEAGVDVLHIKGPAIDARLLAPGDGSSASRSSIDADLLVRPGHVPRMFAIMHQHGWRTAYDFHDGSAFEHAATLVHPSLAPVDLHRCFPGIGLEPERAFETLWADSGSGRIAGYACRVPSLAGQRLILLLQAARAGRVDGEDAHWCWGQATETERAEVDLLAGALDANVALGAATGRLGRYAARREYPLWLALSTGETSELKLWAARVRAAPSMRERVRIAAVLMSPRTGRLATDLGRPPTRREVARAYGSQFIRGLGVLAAAMTHGRLAALRRRGLGGGA